MEKRPLHRQAEAWLKSLRQEEVPMLEKKVPVARSLAMIAALAFGAFLLAFIAFPGEAGAIVEETTCLPGPGVCINEHSVHHNKYCAGGQCVTCIEYPDAVCSEQGGELHDYRGDERDN